MALVVTARPSVLERGWLRGAATGWPRRTLPWLALAAAIAAGAAFTLDGIARVALPTGSADIAIAALQLAALAIACLLAGSVWVSRRDDLGILLAASLAPVVLIARAALPLAMAGLDLPTFTTVAQTTLGYVALGLLVWAAVAALTPPAQAARDPGRIFFGRVSWVTLFALFSANVAGANVQALGADWACRGFPDCNGLAWLPFGREPLMDIQLFHRVLAYLASALIVWLAIEAARAQRPLLMPGLALLVSTLAEAGAGAAIVLGSVEQTQALHVALGATTWASAVTLGVLAHRAPAAQPAVRTATRAQALRLLGAYVQLTKPRVMSLLLATTAAAMVIAARGMPPLGLLVATLIGGALMSGGAGAINHYVDRDIDPLMGRTAWRPIPSGVISPRAALAFGIGLSVLATAVLLIFVNVLATVFALLGLLGYIFIYTLWLKRSTPSNIVIGGAAGALPPLVGWAAVTNELSSLTAWYLFAIIFFWTPPHFWALSLLIRKHYERARVPMLPVVRGDDETRRQIVLYSLLLVALTLVLSPFGMMGMVYYASALVLGAWFIRDALRLWREATQQAARRLYLYSMLYLFALFAAMAVDRSL